MTPRHLPVGLSTVLGLMLFVGCSSTGASVDIWTGTTTLDSGVSSSLRLEVRERDGLLTGSYYVDAARGDFEGEVDGDTLTASLLPSENCSYSMIGTIAGGSIEGSFSPADCPGGQSGSWNLDRQ